MKNKKIILVAAAVVVLGIAGFMLLKNRWTNGSMSNSGQITIMNDSSDTISVAFKENDKEIDKQIAPREKLTCGSDGFVRVFTAQKNGSYEIMYPAGAGEITLSQIASSVKKEEVDNEVFTKKGMIGNIKVTYEEVETE